MECWKNGIFLKARLMDKQKHVRMLLFILITNLQRSNGEVPRNIIVLHSNRLQGKNRDKFNFLTQIKH